MVDGVTMVEKYVGGRDHITKQKSTAIQELDTLLTLTLKRTQESKSYPNSFGG
jgi:hypothetical protein